MSKYEQLLTEIYKIDGDWEHIGRNLHSLLQGGDVQGLKNYLQGVRDVLFLKTCPRHIAQALRNIFEITR